MASWTVEFAPGVRKDFKRLDQDAAHRILKAIKALGKEPRPPASRPLKGSELWRLRVGDYRVVYEIIENRVVVVIVRVRHRREVSRGR